MRRSARKGAVMASGKHLLGRRKNRYVVGTVKVGDKGQIVIPKEARDTFGIHPGDTLLVLGDDENGLIVTRPEIVSEMASRIFKSIDST